MFEFSIWKILGIVSILGLLLTFSKGKNSLWGGLTLGLLIGIVYSFFREADFDWYFVMKFAIVGTCLSILMEIVTFSLNKWLNK